MFLLFYCHTYIRSHFLYFSICRKDNELCDLKKEERIQKFRDIAKLRITFPVCRQFVVKLEIVPHRSTLQIKVFLWCLFEEILLQSMVISGGLNIRNPQTMSIPTYMQVSLVQSHIHTYIHTYVHTCIRTYIHTSAHTSVHTSVHTSPHTWGRTCSPCLRAFFRRYVRRRRLPDTTQTVTQLFVFFCFLFYFLYFVDSRQHGLRVFCPRTPRGSNQI